MNQQMLDDLTEKMITDLMRPVRDVADLFDKDSEEAVAILMRGSATLAGFASAILVKNGMPIPMARQLILQRFSDAVTDLVERQLAKRPLRRGKA